MSAQIEYDIQDIGTLQTKASKAIAINNNGQILGWYNIDGSKEGKCFFVRDRDGAFHELPDKDCCGNEINWRFLTNKNKVYGTFDGNASFSVIYMWDRYNGPINLGHLPGKEISAINDAGQVLIKSIVENENGSTIRRPVIWKNGQVTKLKGLEGNIGIESEESYGLDMNNNGDVVGKSVVSINYKNNIYKQEHAAKWVNGKAIDLHRLIPKSTVSSATAINDLGDVIMGHYLIRTDGEVLSHYLYSGAKATDKRYFYNTDSLIDRQKNIFNIRAIVNAKLNQDYDSIWLYSNKISCANDNSEVIAGGVTIYDEHHAMLLSPSNAND